MSMKWLKERAPGINNISEEELHEITNFSLLWSLFEARVLANNGNAASICRIVDSWDEDGSLRANTYDVELAYFRHRYFAHGNITHHFQNLHLRASDRPDLVRAVIDESNNIPCDCVTAIFIIIYRFRNNLFHGVKWQYQLAGQFDNFSNANSVMMKALDSHGQLDVG